jgi:AraC-like DNA-binding protein
MTRCNQRADPPVIGVRSPAGATLIAITKLPPCAPLAGVVRHFHAWASSRLLVPVVYPVAARPDLFIEFRFGDSYRLGPPAAERRGGCAVALPDVYVVGPRTSRRRDLILSGTVDSFAIHFQPAALSRLFGVPMPELCARPHDAAQVFGDGWRILHGRLADVSGMHARKRLAEEFLLKCLARADRFHPFQDVATRMFAGTSILDIAELARRSHLSTRQFERRFEDGVGVPPKLYQRIVRLNLVARSKMLDPRTSWAALAHDAGYHDHMHLVKDFRQLAAATPTGYFEQRRTFRQWFV